MGIANKALLEIVNSALADESSDIIKYSDIVEAVYSDDELDEATRNLVAGIIAKIASDEESHQMLLETVANVLSES